MTPRRARVGGVALERALSKLGLASRADAQRLIAAGRVRVDGRIVTHPLTRVVPERIRVSIDDEVAPGRGARRVLLLHKPRGTVTTKRDPGGRRTVFEVLGDAGRGLIAVGRLDLASTGLLVFTNDTRLAHRLTDPAQGVVRRYVVTVRGRVTPDTARRLERSVDTDPSRPDRARERLAAARIEIRKASGRETHLIVELTEGKNREIRRMFEATGHEVTRLHRVAFGDYELADLQPGQWREV